MDTLENELWFHMCKVNKKWKTDMLLEGYVPEQIIDMDMKDLTSVGLSITEALKIIEYKNNDEYKNELEMLNKENIEYIFYNDIRYPKLLKNIYDPPVGLFVKGNINLNKECLSVVGARNASEYGKTIAYNLSSKICVYGIEVVSGMARGIDASAHKGALDAKGTTTAVMGSGFGNIYPTSNRKLFDMICENGCVVTEYTYSTLPLAYNFPERNRIISGLSKCTLIVEAGKKSGSLITAGLAAEQGRQVLAVPGNILSPVSIGTNSLIKDGAKPVTELEDIVEEYGDLSIKDNNEDMQLDSQEKLLYDLIHPNGADIATITNNIHLKIEDILYILSKLECKGLIKHPYGQYYIG